MPIPEEWNLSGKSAIITADRRGWTPFLASALAEAGADVASQAQCARTRRTPPKPLRSRDAARSTSPPIL